MLDKLERLLVKWFNTTPKQSYTKLLEQFDHPHVTMTNLPEMLVEFWKRVKPIHFEDGPSARDMMYVQIETRHKSIGELSRLLDLATGALVQEDEAAVMEFAREQFSISLQKTMDDYFAGSKGGTVSFRNGVTLLQHAILTHGQGIENLNHTYHSRVLNRMYNDILYVTKVIIENMPEE